MIILKSRNFDTTETTHRLGELPAGLFPVAYFGQGVLQTIRTYLTKKFKKPVRINIISGYRPQEVNSSTAGASATSFHMWALSPMKCAWDISSPDVTPMQLYEACCMLVEGEVYMDKSQKKVHLAPCGPDEHWVQD